MRDSKIKIAFVGLLVARLVRKFSKNTRPAWLSPFVAFDLIGSRRVFVWLSRGRCLPVRSIIYSHFIKHKKTILKILKIFSLLSIEKHAPVLTRVICSPVYFIGSPRSVPCCPVFTMKKTKEKAPAVRLALSLSLSLNQSIFNNRALFCGECVAY